MHIYTRVKDSHPVEVVPAITGMSAAWTETGAPMTWGDDVFSVIMGTLPEEVLIAKMTQCDALVVMKIGRHLEKVKRALNNTPYFSIIIVHGQGRRP